MDKCPIDHGVDGAIPKALCAVCNPRPKAKVKSVNGKANHFAVTGEKRDFRIPKGMSTEEGKKMLAERETKSREKAKLALDALRSKQQTELNRVNEVRVKADLKPLPDTYVTRMKTNPVANDKMWSKAELPDPASGAKRPSKVAGQSKAPKASREPSVSNELIDGVAIPILRGAFTPDVIKTLMGMLKKGSTSKSMSDKVGWIKGPDCPNPAAGISRFVENVARGHFKKKVTKTGDKDEATYKID